MEKIMLPSGALLDVTMLSWRQGYKVTQLVARALKNVEMDLTDLDLKKEISAANLGMFSSIKGPLLDILSNQEIIEAATLCFPRCTIDGLKIDDDTFEKRESRGDFLLVVFYVLRENIAPFFGGLGSLLKTK